MGSRDRPHKEVKKKPKEKSASPNLAPLTDSSQQAEVIKKERKPRHSDDSDS